MALLVALRWWWLHRGGVTSPEEARDLLARVGYVCAVAVLVILAGTRRWDPRTLGLLGFLFGAAGLLIRVMGRRGPMPVGEAERDLIQSSLEIGALTIFVGLVVWAVVSRLGTRREE